LAATGDFILARADVPPQSAVPVIHNRELGVVVRYAQPFEYLLERLALSVTHRLIFRGLSVHLRILGGLSVLLRLLLGFATGSERHNTAIGEGWGLHRKRSDTLFLHHRHGRLNQIFRDRSLRGVVGRSRGLPHLLAALHLRQD
jgi:hypothetical protein